MNGSFRSWPGVSSMKKYLLALSASLIAATPALAEQADPQITVIATGSATRIDRTGQPVTIITSADLNRIQGQDITRALESVPGLTLTRNGGPGAFTGVRLRGAESEQVLVLIDGVRVEDVSAPSGGFDFGTLTPGGIARIDVLRGSNSVVWGSAAIGGVIAVTSKELNGAEASGEYGAHETATGNAAVGLSTDRAALSINGGYTRTDGISAAAVGTEPDGFRQWRLGGRGRVNLTDELALTASGRYADSRTDIDGYAPPFYNFGDTPEFQKTRQISGRVGARYTGAALTLDGGFAISDTRRQYFDPTFGTDPSYAYTGQSKRVDLTGHLALPSDFALDFGADSEWTRFSSTFDSRETANLTSAHALLGWTTERASLVAGVRLDDHSRFGSKVTFGANGNVRLLDNLRLRASYGEGFKAPTLYQLLSDYGNAALVPERSRSYDVGLEYGSTTGPFHAAATVFRRDSRNLIAFVSCASVNLCATRPFGTYDNIGKARAEGFELELGAKLGETLRAQAVYTYGKARNLTPGSAALGKDLARRPRHALTASLDWTSPLAGLILGGDVRLVGDSFDNAANTTRLDGYYIATVRASLPLGERAELFGRVENVTNQRYETTIGYANWGRAAFIGARVKY
jgi:vitamin B12 transporter